MNRWLTLGLAIVIAEGLASAQSRTPSRPPALTIESLNGRDTFQFYCAPCHGTDGRGQGPVAAALSTAPPDLTSMVARHGGQFPSKDVRDYVTGTGRPIAAHGPGTMPIWGPTFSALDPSDARVKARIDNVVKYIESLQRAHTPEIEKGGR